MHCRHCGKQIEDNSLVCLNCGAAVSGFNSNSVAAPTAETKNRNICSIVGFIISFFGIIGVIFSLVGLILSIIGLVQSKKCQSGKGFGIAGILISVGAFFVHGVIMMFLMPYFIKLFGGAFFTFFFMFLI